MPRPTALSKVSTAALQTELERRISQLASLLNIRERVDRDIAELQALAGQFGKVVAAEAPVKPVRKYRRRKAKATKVVAQPVVVKGKRGQYDLTATEFVLDLLKGHSLTSSELTAAWAKAGRKGRVDNALTILVKAGTISRAKVTDGQGSEYSLAGKPVAKKPAAKPVAKKGKKTFTCPTCKKVFGSGPMLGAHYTTEPAHRRK